MDSFWRQQLSDWNTAAPRSAVFLVLLLVLASSIKGAEPSLLNEAHDGLAALVRELDDDRFEVRRRAHRQLIARGEAALPAVRQAAASKSAEVRARAREIGRQIDHQRLLREFRQLGRTESDAAIDVEHGLVLTAQILDPTVTPEAIDQQLDALAERVRKRLPAVAQPQLALDALRQVLFVEENFDGNRHDYENPANSSIAFVLKSKRGLPILLSQVVLAVGRRLDLPLTGLALPGRFMVKFDGKSTSPDSPDVVLAIDSFEGGKTLTLAELREYLPNLSDDDESIERMLAPAESRTTLVRVLNNLASACLERDDLRRAREVDAYRQALHGAIEGTDD